MYVAFRLVLLFSVFPSSLLTYCFTMNIELFVVLDRVSRIVYMYILYLLLQAGYSWVRFRTYSSFGWVHLDRGLTGLGCLVRCLRGRRGGGKAKIGHTVRLVNRRTTQPQLCSRRRLEAYLDALTSAAMGTTFHLIAV